jgi:hypothetical protein
MKLFLRAFLMSLLLTGSGILYGQNQARLWQKIDESSLVNLSDRVTIPRQYQTFKLNRTALESELGRAPMEFSPSARPSAPIIKLPMPDGSLQRFRVFESPVMEPGLAQKFPNIKTYSGEGIDDPTATLRMDINPKGFHAVILNATGDIYIDPYAKSSKLEMISYHGQDHQRSSVLSDFSCGTFEEVENLVLKGENTTEATGDELRTYRTAVAATGEFTAFHGGTVADGLAAIVTVINRLNSIYEREVAIRLILVNNNNLVIYTDPANDPYTNNNNFTMLGENQNNLDNVIGSGNYDVGHVIGTLGGGVAILGGACQNNAKGRGVSSDPTPVGDALTVRVVCHEFGHLFAANHTFNGTVGGCGGGNRSGSTAYEPGSGSTIMSYAGLCGPHNVTTITSPYFHTNSYESMTNYSRLGGASNCANVINTGNNPPVVSVGTGGFVVPIETPLVLRGSATDPDNDTLTYCWEQYNTGPGGAPNTPSGTAPAFRSLPPTLESDRTLPQISSIINSSTPFSEVLPTYSRNLTFRLTARDNRAGGGGVDFQEISFTATDQAGPFRVISPNNGGTWEVDTWETITWDPANTNNAPVNSFLVNILLSTDGGFTYPITLATNLPNIGTANVKVPNVPGFGNRIRVEAADNIFFDISDENIDIVAPAAPGFAYFTQNEYQNSCAPDDIVFDIITSAQLGFSSMVNLTTQNLPSGLTATLSQTVVNPDDTTLLTITNTNNVAPGLYTFEVVGTATSGETKTLSLSVDIQNNVPDPVDLAFPLNGATNIAALPTFFWVPLPGDNDYLFELATSPSFGASTVFSTPVDTNTFTLTTPLNLSTPYFWRISASNVCGSGDNSEISAFQTESQGTPPTAPQVITNLPLNVIQWKDEFISPAFLEASDGVTTPNNLVYTLVGLPQNGFVELNTQPLTAGGTFTQNDINTGAVKYQHNGTNTSSDAFTFTVENPNGGWVGTPTFQITVTNTTSISDLNDLQINLFPNPANETINLSLSGSYRGQVNLTLFTAHGKLIEARSLLVSGNESREKWNTSKLPAGIYLLKVNTQDGEMVRKIVVRH